MPAKSDEALGMHAAISRRDLIHQAGAAALGLALAPLAGSVRAAMGGASPAPDAGHYPPVRTGLRGSHPGAFETAHAIAREGREFPAPRDLDEAYDLVVVGAGLSGLAAAHFYRQRYGDEARILLLENHDDFGGHAKRNEFHQGGRMVLALGGTHNLEWWAFSDTVNGLLDDYGVDVEAMRANMDFDYGHNGADSKALWFDEETYGVNRLVRNCSLWERLTPDLVDQFPISAAGRSSLKRFYAARENVLAAMGEQDAEDHLRSISYPEFLRRYGGLTDDAVQLFDTVEHGGEGLEMRAFSAMEAIEGGGLPGTHLLGGDWAEPGRDYPVAMWPDGNAGLARLMVAGMIPGAAPGANAGNIAVAQFDYSALDQPTNPVRLRLNATAINVHQTDQGVQVSYVSGDAVLRVSARHCVLACWHSIVPHLCPELPEAQKSALRAQVKIPMLQTNVLLRDTRALDKLGIHGARCPGRMHENMYLVRGINTGGYNHPSDDTGPVCMQFFGTLSPPDSAEDLYSQLRGSRARMLALEFSDYEREVRTVLDGMLGPAGFDVAKDVLAITVNRWPHGYAREYMDLWDEDYPEGQAPHEQARKPFGAITIANSDAGASAYTHVAIDQAWRAISELPD